MLTGASIANVTKVKQSDIFSDQKQTVVGVVAISAALISAEEPLKMGTLLRSTDGGKNWEALTTASHDVASTYAVDDEVYFEGGLYKSTVVDNTTVPDVGDWDYLGIWASNGVLYNDLLESKKTTVVVSGSVKQKYLHGYDEFLRVPLFDNKILVK
ncbi:MAG: hypothetical protein GQ570_10340 [Helicobacteraceae bacterium]|nr:hypothetical protein [Helicobacteraceae bacterium]